MTLLDDLLTDLTAEGDRLRAVVADLGPGADGGWATETPAAGWTVATQVAHLAWTDEAATAAARTHLDPEPWDTLVIAGMADPTGFVDTGAHELATLAPADLLARWDAGRLALAEALRAVPAGERMPWFGPPMAPPSMVTARFMETWAHALDVHAALGLEVEQTDRIRHVAHIGVRTRGYSFVNRGLDVPTAEVRVVLTAPSGATWAWGSEDAPESVTGSALDFCQLVTQRVHRADTDLVATGPGADAWLDVAQSFAGPAGPGREAVGRG
ncbi:TIGR03084 family metal-binding protein [Nocardioides sp.]|uniref:TIGR03084 family metal-binding protein n=1 Tax=Nocardioides sp. TaxID=35761 RepID=UPI00271F1033|nr:TIGR03084 family metal-binding protein [Nocardioides sp.]MDO9457170.1 TIGR03084 family metal-binding protein [Nocardioides sp.]